MTETNTYHCHHSLRKQHAVIILLINASPDGDGPLYLCLCVGEGVFSLYPTLELADRNKEARRRRGLVVTDAICLA